MVGEDGKTYGIYTRCPHCGMVDPKHSSQSIRNSHFAKYTVKGVTEYECGNCRKNFSTIQVTVPDGMDPFDFYDQISALYEKGSQQ
jgi:transcription elongation factor Elf1